MGSDSKNSAAASVEIPSTAASEGGIGSRIDWALSFGTVATAFADTASHYPEHAALAVLPETAEVYGIRAGEISYARLAERVYELYAAYHQAGYRLGDRVGLLLENRPMFYEHWLALNSLGVSVVPISADLRGAELAYLISHSGIKLAVAIVSHHRLLHEACARTGETLVVMDLGDAIPERRADHGEFVHRELTPLPDRHTECALLYTSGTTGQPKGCVLSNEYFLFAGGWYLDLGGLCALTEASERLITPLPLNHMNAMACSSMAMLLSGGCIIQVDRFHPKTWWQSVRDSGATALHYLGVMPSMLMLNAEQASDRQHLVRFGFGAGVDKRLHEPFEARFGFPLVEGWAMTETGVGACIIAHTEPRHRGQACMGKPSESVSVRLVGDDGTDVELGLPGELQVRRGGTDPHLGFFSRYLKDEEATNEAWRGGWFHTGDMVRADVEGYLYFIDRKKNVIRRSGENISAVEVETVLRRHPSVRDVAVAATPDAVRGDEVLACVVLKDQGLSDEVQAELALALTRHCLTDLAYYKAPGWVFFLPSLPLTLTQKVQRGELKKIAAALPGQPGCHDTRALKKREAVS